LYAIGLPITVIVYVWFEEPTNATAKSELSGDETGDDYSYMSALSKLLRHRRVFVILVARSLRIVVWTGFLTYNSIIVVNLLDGSPAEAGILAAIGSFSFTMAASQSGRVTNFFAQISPTHPG